MRTVSVSQRLGAPPKAVLHALDPTSIIEAEGTFRVVDVVDEADGRRVVARGGGMEVTYRFEETDDGYVYEALDEVGPFEALTTRLVVAPEDEGSRVTMESTVSLSLPIPAVSDRVAAWKRRGELRRALRAIEERA